MSPNPPPNHTALIAQNDFVVDIHDDLVPGIGDQLHRVNQEVTGDGLDAVLDEFPTVGF